VVRVLSGVSVNRVFATPRTVTAAATVNVKAGHAIVGGRLLVQA
jgi:hypothetical protein